MEKIVSRPETASLGDPLDKQGHAPMAHPALTVQGFDAIPLELAQQTVAACGTVKSYFHGLRESGPLGEKACLVGSERERAIDRRHTGFRVAAKRHTHALSTTVAHGGSHMASGTNTIDFVHDVPCDLACRSFRHYMIHLVCFCGYPLTWSHCADCTNILIFNIAGWFGDRRCTQAARQHGRTRSRSTTGGCAL